MLSRSFKLVFDLNKNGKNEMLSAPLNISVAQIGRNNVTFRTTRRNPHNQEESTHHKCGILGLILSRESLVVGNITVFITNDLEISLETNVKPKDYDYQHFTILIIIIRKTLSEMLAQR